MGARGETTPGGVGVPIGTFRNRAGVKPGKPIPFGEPGPDYIRTELRQEPARPSVQLSLRLSPQAKAKLLAESGE